ncbi:hypothetical protein D1007_42773 [Hordeum vulgare]|nr:hypothetical protein D1007_42773 [Hordeum vulgare]
MGFYWVAKACRWRKSSAEAFNGKGWRQVMEGGQLSTSSSEKREVSLWGGTGRKERVVGKGGRRIFSVGSATSNCSSQRPESIVNDGGVKVSL